VTVRVVQPGQHGATAGVDRAPGLGLDALVDRGDAVALDRDVDRRAVVPDAGVRDEQVHSASPPRFAAGRARRQREGSMARGGRPVIGTV
jgi:hypothetical protein